MASRTEDLWSFSLRVYGSAGVAPSCLALQERHRIDVNVLLYACWLGAVQGRGIDNAAMKKILSAAAPWHDEIVRPLRRLRQRLKAGFPPAPEAESKALRTRIKATELDSERIEQMILSGLDHAALQSVAPGADAAWGNARAYFTLLGARLSDEDSRNIAIIVGAAMT